MPFDRFGIVAAAWTFAAEWHQGGASARYALFGTRALRAFQPGPGFDLHAPSAREEWSDARARLARYIRCARSGREPFRDRRN